MIHTNRFLGAVLLIAGTSIGGGMLAIPIMTAFAGFLPSLFLLGVTWLYMLITAFLFLEVNLSIKGEINLVTMAEKTLGSIGKVVAWVCYLLLLYALLSAYIAGSGPLFANAIDFIFGITMPKILFPLPLIVLFGIFVYLGTRAVDYVNRLLMLGLMIAYFLLIFLLPAHINVPYLTHMDAKAVTIAIPLVFTSFGFHIIIPSLTNYLNRDRKKLYTSLIIGSLITLFVYVLWEYLILGVLPLSGEHGLISAYIQGDPSTTPLMQILTGKSILIGSRLFAFFALITSFLGVSLSLSAFLRDGFKIKKTGTGQLFSCLLTFIPPLFFVYFYERGFILALQYAAIFVMILLAIMPALMAWTLKDKYRGFFKKCLLVTVILGALFVIAIDFLEEAGMLNQLISSYVSAKE